MGKRNKQTAWKKVMIGTGVVLGTLALAIAALALLIQKGMIGTDTKHIGLTICSLISGAAGAVYTGKGEGGVKRLLACLIPASVIILIAALGSKEAGSITVVIIYASALLLPSVVSEAATGGRRRKGGRNRKRRSVKKAYR